MGLNGADAEGMTLNTLETEHGYRVVQWTQHWSLIGGAWYRDAVAIRVTDGARRLISVLEPAL